MSTRKDLTGKRFGKLFVLQRTDNPNNKAKAKKRYWLCKCDCGNTSIVPTNSLTSGRIQQCWDCAHLESGKAKRKSLVGQRFGKLTVSKMIYGDKNSRGEYVTKCICKCDCGNEVTRLATTLTNSNCPSCGCAKRELIRNACGTDVDGMRFGRLTVLETLWDESPVRLRCLCDCGKEVTPIKGGVTYGKTQSCGCLQRDMITKSNEKDWTGHISDYGVAFITQSSKNTKGQWLWNCKCGECNTEFVALPAKVNNGSITSCGCRASSANEELIANYLQSIGVNFKREFTFEHCVYKNTLKFDFAIFEKKTIKCLIEYDGAQHYMVVDFLGGEEGFKSRQLRDNIKNKYCKENNIPLLRLPYSLTAKEIKQQILKILNDCGVSMVT